MRDWKTSTRKTRKNREKPTTDGGGLTLLVSESVSAAAAPARRAAAREEPFHGHLGVTTMRLFGKLALALGAVVMMSTPAWAQGRGGFGGGGGAMLLTNKGVQKELKVTDDQASKLTTFSEEMRAKQREAFQGLQDLSDDERRTKMQELQRSMQADMKKGLTDILKPEQLTRFQQIQRQQMGAQAFLMPDVADTLKITDEQKTKLQEIQQESGQQMREVFQEFQNDREGATKKMAELRKASTDKAMAVLTDSQKKSWKDMIGEPFEVKFEPRPN